MWVYHNAVFWVHHISAWDKTTNVKILCVCTDLLCGWLLPYSIPVFSAVCMSAVTNTRFSHCALSYRLSSFAKWTVPVADILQIQSNWLHKSHSESLNLTSSHSRSLRTEPEERLLMDFSSFWRSFSEIPKKLLFASSCLSLCPRVTTRFPTGRIFIKFDILWAYFENFKFN
jgi:hypothetical protein